MRVNTQAELDELYASAQNITETKRDDAGNLVSFKYVKYYNGKRAGKREISVAIRQGGTKNRGQKVYLPEAEFFNQLADNYKELKDIKITSDKIVGYTLKRVKYVTDAPETVTPFDIFDYKKFLKITWQRFWNRDDLLRNGYFGGLTGCSGENIAIYEGARIFEPGKYRLYDFDINHAYPYHCRFPLPCGRFYDEDEFNSLSPEQKPRAHICFYHINIKTIPNRFNLYIPLPPYLEFSDFDFLIGRNEHEMIVSEYRLHLIDMIYGSEAYIVKKVYYCGAKIYLGLVDAFDKSLAEIDEKRASGARESDWVNQKIATNSVIGLFGKRDETKSIIGLEKRNNDIWGEVFVPKYSQSAWKKANNYLPLAMVINDMTAVRLFYALTQPGIGRISWNTDGGIIAVNSNAIVQNSKKIGCIKSKEIFDAVFYSTSALYYKPLVYDKATDEVYNSKCIYWGGGNFYINQIFNVNSRRGFFRTASDCVLPVEEYKHFDLRYLEVKFKADESDAVRRAFKNPIFKADAEKELAKLMNPFSSDYNIVRRAPEKTVKIKYKFLNKYFIKNA